MEDWFPSDALSETLRDGPLALFRPRVTGTLLTAPPRIMGANWISCFIGKFRNRVSADTSGLEVSSGCASVAAVN